MSRNKTVMLLESFQPLARVQGAVEIRPLELVKEIGMVPDNDRQFRPLQELEPLLGIGGKNQSARTIFCLLENRPQFVTGVNQRGGFCQCLD